MIDLDRLWDLVRAFLEEHPQWVQSCSEPLCDEASDAFCWFCLRREVDAVPRWGALSRGKKRGLAMFLPWIVRMDQRYPLRDSLSGADEHCVAVVDDRWVVDFTARQYGDDMPFPFLWELDPSDRLDPLDRRNDDPRVGDRVRARCFINMAAAKGDEGVVLKVLPGRRMGFVDFSPRNLPASSRATVLFSDGEVEVVERCPSPAGRLPPPEIFTDGTTVWINGSCGGSLGRFGPRGVDVHTTAKEQAEGKGQCLFCTHPPTKPDWRSFTDAMRRFHQVDVSDAYCPEWARQSPTSDREIEGVERSPFPVSRFPCSAGETSADSTRTAGG